jgi:hypothetical protein
MDRGLSLGGGGAVRTGDEDWLHAPTMPAAALDTLPG